MISSLVVAGLPELFRREVGERAVARAMQTVGVDLEFVEREVCFIPHAAVLGFIKAAALATGEAEPGLLVAPWVSVNTYGLYGRFALGAETLGGAIERCINALAYHSTGDAMTLSSNGKEARFAYRFALAGRPDYPLVAPAAAAVLLGLCLAYMPSGWRPLRIELDGPRPRRPDLAEDVFRCPVLYGAPTVAIVLRHRELVARGVCGAQSVTLADLARERMGPAPRSRFDVIVEQIRVQVLSGAVSIEAAARAMDISVRSLQRELNTAGTDFRGLVSLERNRRAKELLRQRGDSVTAIATDLGYTAPANFARAFRREAGLSPRDFRRS